MSVLQITVVGLNTFLAQWCKHPNLPIPQVGITAHGGLWYSQKQNIAALEVLKADLYTFMRQRYINPNQTKQQYRNNHCKIGSKRQITTYHCTMKV